MTQTTSEQPPIDMDDLSERVLAFKLMELPGQPRLIHLGTNYLVSDLWRAVQALAARSTQGDQP